MQQIKKAVQLMLSSRKPVLYVGGGAVNAEAQEELVELAELP